MIYEIDSLKNLSLHEAANAIEFQDKCPKCHTKLRFADYFDGYYTILAVCDHCRYTDWRHKLE